MCCGGFSHQFKAYHTQWNYPYQKKTTAYDDVIKWKHFPRYWTFVRGIHRSPVNSPHKGQWRGTLMYSLICAWINRWVNNREAGDTPSCSSCRHRNGNYPYQNKVTAKYKEPQTRRTCLTWTVLGATVTLKDEDKMIDIKPQQNTTMRRPCANFLRCSIHMESNSQIVPMTSASKLAKIFTGPMYKLS